MMKKVTIFIAIGMTLGGCATKRYGRLTPLTGAESVAYDCNQIRIELAKTEAFETQITEGSKVNGASALGFLADFGIGNAMEKGEAQASAAKRKSQLRDLYAQKRCDAAASGPPGSI